MRASRSDGLSTAGNADCASGYQPTRPVISWFLGDRYPSIRVRASLDGSQWAHQDSNLGPTGYEPAALTRLSYTPNPENDRERFAPISVDLLP